MSGPKRNPDKLNTIGVVVVGVCAAVLVYVTIVALQAFYMNDTSELQTMADYGGQDSTFKSLRSTQKNNINEAGPNGASAKQTYRIPIDVAIKLVARDVKEHPEKLVPAVGPSDHPFALPIFGRPKEIPSAAGSGSEPAPAGGAAPPAGAGSGSGAVMTPTAGQAGGGAPPAPPTQKKGNGG